MSGALQRTCCPMKPRGRGGSGGPLHSVVRSRWRVATGPLAAFAALLALPPHARAQAVKTLVSNTGQTNDASVAHVVGTVRCSKFSEAQRFTTDDNEGGNSLSSIQNYLKDYAGIDGTWVNTYSANASDNPGSSRYTLINPRLAMSGSLNTFNARSNATLEKVKQYLVVVKTASRSLQIGLRVNDKFPGQV